MTVAALRREVWAESEACVEIGAVLWKFPAALEPVRADYRVAVSAANVRSGLL